MHIRKGDTVKILAGRERGKAGKVLTVNEKLGRAVVEGKNITVRHEKPRRSGEKGQKVQFPAPIHVSKLMLVCPHCAKTTRAAHMIDDKNLKTRVCKHCGKRI